MAGVLQHLHRLAVQHIGALFTDGTAGETGLAEPASTDTAAKYFQIGALVNNFGGGNDHLGGIVGIIQIFDDPLCHLHRCTVNRCDCSNGTVFLICVFIERRHINAGNLGNLQKERFLAPTLRLCTVIQCNDLRGDLLAFTQSKEVNKVSQGFRIKGTYTAGKHNIVQTLSVLCVERNTCQRQHIEDIGVAHLVADGDGDHIKVFYGILAFQRPQRQMMLAHLLFHIPPGCKDTLAPNAVHFVHDAVKDPHTHIGHADLVGIRETECHTDTDIVLILFDLIEFAAGIPGRFLHGGENSLQ